MKITILAFDGTESIAATEWNLLTDAAFAADANTTEGEFQANIDINNFTGAEVMTFRVYEKMRTSASAQRLIYEFALSIGVLGNAKGWQSPKFTLGNGWAMTMQLTSGTTKTVIWSIHRWQSGGTEAAIAAIQADTDDIQTRLPAALVSGRIDASVGAMAAAVITAASIATDAFTAAKFAANAGTEIAAAVWDALTSGLSTASSIGKLLVDNIDAAITSRASQTSVNTIDDFLDTEIASIQADTDDIQTRLPSALVGGRMDSSVGAMAANVLTAAATAADFGTEVAAAVWDRLTSALSTASSIGKLLVDNVNATISSRASQTSVDTVDDFLDTEIAAIKAKTDNLPSDPADASDIAGAFTSLNTKVDTIDDFLDTEIAAIKAKTDNLPSDPADASDIAALFLALPAAVWDRLTSALTTVGSAGKLLADNLNATVSSRASQTSVDTIDDFVDTEVAAIKAKTDNLPSDPADASDIAAAFASLNTKVDTIDDFLDTEVAAIKAKTDNLPSDPADASDIAAAFTSLNTKVDTIDDFLDTEVAAIKAKTDNLPSDPADASDIAAAFTSLNTKVDTIDDFLDTEVAAIKAKTDNLPSDPADASVVAGLIADLPTADENADALLDRADAVETGLTFRQAMRAVSAVLFGKVSGAGTTAETFRNAEVDDTDRVVVTADADGNRTDVVTDLT